MPLIFKTSIMAENKSTEGLPMFVESLMTSAEWRENMKRYPNTCHISFDHAHREKPNSMQWRKGMGAIVPKAERDNINANLDYLMKNAGLKTKS